MLVNVHVLFTAQFKDAHTVIVQHTQTVQTYNNIIVQKGTCTLILEVLYPQIVTITYCLLLLIQMRKQKSWQVERELHIFMNINRFLS